MATTEALSAYSSSIRMIREGLRIGSRLRKKVVQILNLVNK